MPDDPYPNAPRVGNLMAFARLVPVSVVLIIASCVVALVSHMGEDLEVLTWLTLSDLRDYDGTLASGPLALMRGEVWRLITPIFIHFGPIHLIFNMLWMKDLGPIIERRWSSRHLVALVIVTAVLSNVAQYVVNWDFTTGISTANAKSGGMSGVVYALLGYLWIRGHRDPAVTIRLPSSVVIMMLGWFVLCLTGLMGAIGNTAHGVGLLVGMVWAWAVTRRMGREVDRER